MRTTADSPMSRPVGRRLALATRQLILTAAAIATAATATATATSSPRTHPDRQ